MRILFPTDFSNAAENAFVFALKVAKHLKAQVTVLHIYSVPEISPWIDFSRLSREINEEVTLDEFEHFKDQIEVLKRIEKENGVQDLDVNYSLRESKSVVPAILAESNEVKTDLIIMGTTGASGLKEMIFGSVASKVMEESGCPVLLVPEKAVYRGMVRIGLTMDYLPEDRPLVKETLAFAKKLGAHLYCFHVDIIDQHKKQGKSNPLPADFKNDPDISFHTTYSLDIEKGILEYCKEHQLDMLVMRVHHRNRLREIISYSLAKKVAYHTHIPMLTFHVEAVNQN